MYQLKIDILSSNKKEIVNYVLSSGIYLKYKTTDRLK